MRPMFLSAARARLSMPGVFGSPILLLAAAVTGAAQAPMSPMASAGQSTGANSTDQNQQLADQVTELRAQVARLQVAVHQNANGAKVTAKSGMRMSPAPAKGMGEMGMAPKAGMAMTDGQGEMGGMPSGGNAPMAPGMGMMEEMGGMAMGGKSAMSAAPAPAMGMCCGGEMGAGGGAMPPAGGAMAGMSNPSSAMPGQAGASHLYHIGSNGFFLNHSQHITLTADQKFTLNRDKEKAMLNRASAQRRIDQSEQELYTLTGSDQLDNSKVQAKIGEIEKLRGDQRMNFIQAVSEASNVLTQDQRQALLGTMAAIRK